MKQSQNEKFMFLIISVTENAWCYETIKLEELYSSEKSGKAGCLKELAK